MSYMKLVKDLYILWIYKLIFSLVYKWILQKSAFVQNSSLLKTKVFLTDFWDWEVFLRKLNTF